MSRVRASNTKPELMVRRGLHARGLRYRLHSRSLIGTPDLVFPKARVVVFIHGCFWHGHDCFLGVRPKSNAAFWDQKVQRNSERDTLVLSKLIASGWRVAAVWECSVRGRGRLPLDHILDTLEQFIRNDATSSFLEVRGAAIAIP